MQYYYYLLTRVSEVLLRDNDLEIFFFKKENQNTTKYQENYPVYKNLNTYYTLHPMLTARMSEILLSVIECLYK